MKTDSTRKEECEICGKAVSRFVMLGQKGSNNADFYWICEHCEKAIRWLFARIDESEKEECKNSREEEQK
jgi:hypothetical protein